MSAQTIQRVNARTSATKCASDKRFRDLIQWILKSIRAGQSNAYFARKKRHADKANSHTDILSSLPLSEKQRLGMHNYID